MKSDNSLDAEKSAFVEKFGVLMAEAGLPRSIGRVWGLLLICEPAQQSAEDIQQKLSLSSGSVSNAMTLLTKTRLVKRVTRAGDRRIFYEADPDCWRQVLQARVDQVERGIAVAQTGLAINPNDRLRGMLKLYESFDELTREIQEKFL